MFEPLVVEPAALTEEVLSATRRWCGYGCVRCGVTVYRYFSVPKAAGEGDADDDAPSLGLLCPECLDLLGRRVDEAGPYRALLARPIARDRDFDRRHLPYHVLLPEMRAGGPTPVRDTAVPVSVGGVVPLTFSPPIHGMGATRLSVQLSDDEGPLCRVVDANVWCPGAPGWRFAHRGTRYVIEKDGGAARLELDFPASNRVTIVHLRTRVGARLVELTPDWLEVDGQRSVGAIRSGQLIGCTV